MKCVLLVEDLQVHQKEDLREFLLLMEVKPRRLNKLVVAIPRGRVSTLPRLRNQMSHSADAVNKNLKTRPKVQPWKIMLNLDQELKVKIC